MAIRPEYMDVSKTPVEGFDLPGTVKDFIYQGTVVKTALDIKNGQEIKYSRFEQDTDIAEGNQVYVYWRPEKPLPSRRVCRGRSDEQVRKRRICFRHWHGRPGICLDDFVCDHSDAVYYLYQFYVQRCIR